MTREIDARESSGDGDVSPTRYRDLERRVEENEGKTGKNGEDLRELKTILEEQNESYEGFKRGYEADRKEDSAWRLEMAKTMGEMAGTQRAGAFWVKVLVGLAAAALTALVALVALAMRHSP